MHHCLYVPELASRIAEACAPDYRDVCTEATRMPELGTVYALARTCRALQGPALDVIWYYQFGLQNLVKCMPEDLWEISKRENPDDRRRVENGGRGTIAPYDELRLRTNREINLNDWQRFDFYAQRVHQVKFHQYMGCYLWRFYAEAEESLVHKLQEVKGSPLLPNVQRMFWYLSNMSDESLGQIKNLITPTLTSLDLLCLQNGGKPLLGFLVDLRTRCPRMRRLRLNASLEFTMLPSVLPAFSSLEQFSLQISDIGQYEVGPLLSVLASLPKLSTLHLNNGVCLGSEGIASPFSFPSLRVWSLNTTDASSTIGILENCDYLAHLTKFSIYCTMPDPNITLALLSVIRSRISPDVLRSFTLLHTVWSSATQKMAVSFSSLTPLLAFHNLDTLSFQPTELTINLTDDDLETLARSCPYLRSLTILGDQQAKAARPTYQGLAHLVRLCQSLQSIELSIAETEAGSASTLDNLPVSACCDWVNFVKSGVGDLEFASSWVARMFPHYLTRRRRDRSLPTEERLVLRRIPSDPDTVPLPGWEDVMDMAERKMYT